MTTRKKVACDLAGALEIARDGWPKCEQVANGRAHKAGLKVGHGSSPCLVVFTYRLEQCLMFVQSFH